MWARSVLRVAVALGVVTLLFWSIGGQGIPAPAGAQATASSSPPSASGPTLLPPGEINSSVAGAYQMLIQNLSGNPNNYPSEASVDSSILGMFLELNATDAFNSLVSTWGVDNFTFTLNYLVQSGISNATFGEQWVASGQDGGLAYQEYWVGTVSTGTLTGPFETTPTNATYNGGYAYSTNWAGLAYSTPSSSSSITNAWAYTTVASLFNPPQSPANVPYYAQVDAFGSVWVGVSPTLGGSNGLLQAGYEYDVQGNFHQNYQAWYEYYTPGGQNAISYPGAAIPKPGDAYGIDLLYSGWNVIICNQNWWGAWSCSGPFQVWNTYVCDYTQGACSSSTENVPINFAPIYKTEIVEAVTTGGSYLIFFSWSHIMQIPEFGNIHMWGGNFIAGGVTYSDASEVQNNDFTQITMTQSSGSVSTSEAFTLANAPSPMSGFGYLTVAWQNSNYDWNYV